MDLPWGVLPGGLPSPARGEHCITVRAKEPMVVLARVIEQKGVLELGRVAGEREPGQQLQQTSNPARRSA
jgi:hypothetical protein